MMEKLVIQNLIYVYSSQECLLTANIEEILNNPLAGRSEITLGCALSILDLLMKDNTVSRLLVSSLAAVINSELGGDFKKAHFELFFQKDIWEIVMYALEEIQDNYFKLSESSAYSFYDREKAQLQRIENQKSML